MLKLKHFIITLQSIFVIVVHITTFMVPTVGGINRTFYLLIYQLSYYHRVHCNRFFFFSSNRTKVKRKISSKSVQAKTTWYRQLDNKLCLWNDFFLATEENHQSNYVNKQRQRRRLYFSIQRNSISFLSVEKPTNKSTTKKK